MKRLTVTAFLAVACFGASAASSTATTIGGCPTGSGATWTLVNATEFFGLPPGFPTSTIPGLDENADGLTCVREITRFPIEGRNNFLYRDNTV